MPFSMADFIKQVKTEIEFRFDLYSYTNASKDLPFAQWILELLFPNLDSDQAFELLVVDSYWKVTARYKDENNGVFYILSAHFSENPSEATFGPGVAYNLLDFYKKVENNSTDTTTVQTNKDVFQEAFEAQEDGYKLVSILALFGKLDALVQTDEICERYQISSKQLVCLDLDELRRLYTGADTHGNDETITLPFIQSVTEYPGPVEAIIGNVKASDLKQAVMNHIPQIYDSNLRIPLGATKINKEMTKTLSDPEQRQFFWYFNNGITMLCKEYRLVTDAPPTFKVLSPRIVNGAQTTDSLISSDLTSDDNVSIMVRLIAALPNSLRVEGETLSSNDLQDLCLDIARYTNSQNPIDIPDFRSNEEVQKRLHDKFNQLGWFYEHRRGQWEACENKTEYRVENRFQKLTMIDVAQRWYAFDGQPAIAIREKQSLFEAQGPYGKIFMFARSAEEFLAAYLIFEQIEEKIAANIRKAKTENARATETGARISLTAKNYLMIGRATKRAVAHMAALLGRGIKERYGTFTQEHATQVLESVTDGRLIRNVYPELEDTLFRKATQLQDEKYKTLHRLLSENDAIDDLYDIFKYVVEREMDKGRDVMAL